MATAITPRKPGPPLWLGITILVIGIAIAVAAGIGIAVKAVQTFSSSSVDTPGVIQRHLSSGKWTVFQQTGTDLDTNNSPDLTPDEVTVTGPDGARIAVDYVASNETITRNTRVYTAAVQFHAASGGQYEIRIDSQSASSVLVQRSLGDTFRRVLALAGIGSVGGLLVIIGITLLIVGGVRRSRAKHPVAAGWRAPPPVPVAAPGVPAGWYPDQQMPGRSRYWDGTAWTEHRQ